MHADLKATKTIYLKNDTYSYKKCLATLCMFVSPSAVFMYLPFLLTEYKIVNCFKLI